MGVMVTPACAVASTGQMKVLFLGNSHTYVNNVPQLVRSLGLTASRPVDMNVESVSGGHLEDLARQPGLIKRIQEGHYDYVVLQAAMVSQSHKHEYSHDGAVEIARVAVAARTKVLMFPEWSRRGIDETEYTERVYRGIVGRARGAVAPVGRVWDKVRGHYPLELWAPDGNHASLAGSFLAANVLFRWLVDDGKTVTTFRPSGVSRVQADLFQAEIGRAHV